MTARVSPRRRPHRRASRRQLAATLRGLVARRLDPLVPPAPHSDRPRRRDRVAPWWQWLAVSAVLLAPAAATAAPAPARPPADAAMSEDDPLPPVEVHNSCKKQPLGSRFHVTLSREARLVDLVRWMSSISCQKFIWSPAVRDGKVTVVSPEPITLQQAYAAFYAALETMNLTVEHAGDYLKIIESKDASRQVLPVYKPGQRAPARDHYVTQLLRPHEGRVDDVVSVVEHLKGDRGTVQAVGELVIITDTGTNMARMLRVIEEVDVETAGEQEAIFLHPLLNADPEEVARVVQEVFMAKASPGATSSRSTKTRTPKSTGKAKARSTSTSSPSADDRQAQVTALSVDPRTRTLIITAPRDEFPVVRRLIERLDVTVPDDAGTLFVLPLRHADPEELAQVLGSLPAGPNAETDKAAPRGQAPGTASAGVSIGGEIHITADPSTRSLVIMASHQDFLAVKRVVEALDVERRLVYIEAYILELSTETGLETGASAHFGRINEDGALSFVSSQPGGGSSLAIDAGLLDGLAAGVLGPAIEGSADLFGQDIPSFGVVINALETHEDVNIVADPHLYTADNKTAKMEVGQTVPVPNGTSTFGAAGGTPVSQTTYSRQPVSLKLEVTPHVGEGGTMTMDIIIENQELKADSESEAGPITTQRKLELEAVTAHDGQPVVLGGLVQEKEQITRRQLPGLGSIPLLGWLFKNRRRTREKVNLLVVLVPHVLDSPDDARRIHQRRLRERREFLERESAFKRRDLDTHVNYRRKSGLLATVNSEAGRMEDEHRLHAQAQVELMRSAARQIAPEGTHELTATEEPGPVSSVTTPTKGAPDTVGASSTSAP